MDVTSANVGTVSVDPSQNAGAIVLSEADLDALPDDPDDLEAQLTAMAGPAAGPNGPQIFIDGFSGGQMPPKSSIREIRINSRPLRVGIRQSRIKRAFRSSPRSPVPTPITPAASFILGDRAFDTRDPFKGDH